jgi:putative redox protein
MYETTVKFRSGVSFDVESRGHKLVSDQPREIGGADDGMTPPELFLASIGTCAGYYAIQYLKARNLPQEGLNVRVWAEKAMQPARIGTIRIDVEAPGAEDEKNHAGLVRAVEKCLIHNTLLHTPEIAITVQPIPATV